jgi:hypothetical protein
MVFIGGYFYFIMWANACWRSGREIFLLTQCYGSIHVLIFVALLPRFLRPDFWLKISDTNLNIKDEPQLCVK